MGLHEETLKLVNEERRITGLVIENLQKISDTRLFLKMSYSSLYEYCTRALGYSEACAYRRIQAVKIVKELPEIRAKLDSGVLNLTNLTMAQSFFTSEAKTQGPRNAEQKREVLAKIENCSKRQAEEVLANAFNYDRPERPRESVRALAGGEASLHVRLMPQTLPKIDRIKSLRSHVNVDMTYTLVIDDMCDIVLKKIDPMLRPSVTPTEKKYKNARYISPDLKTFIFKRDRGICAYVDKTSGKRCGSNHLLQIDHVKPIFLGGETTSQNLRLLCFAHHKDREHE
jgi:hypothetical protein